MKRIKFAVALALLLCAAIALCACAKKPVESTSNEATYKVTVKDSQGNPYSNDIIVKFLQNGEQVAMQRLGVDGVAEKNLPKGDYTVELDSASGDKEYRYITEDLTLTAEKTELEIVLALAAAGEKQTVFARVSEEDGGKNYEATHVKTGSTYVDLVGGERNYFLFTPKQAGTYEFTLSGCDGIVGYYGSPYFVQIYNISESSDKARVKVSISANMIGTNGTGTSILVIGVDAPEGAKSAVLSVERIGEPEWSIADEPWTTYTTTHTPAPYVLPEGAVIKDFDLKAATNAYELVLGEADGYYHLNSADGPLVYLRLGVNTPYLDSIEAILENTGLVCYFYDDAGEFEKKESYTEILIDYVANMDEASGLYPLTEDLKYIVQHAGEHLAWWDPDSGVYRFVDADGNKIPGINHDIAWLFLCCYAEKPVEEPPVEPTVPDAGDSNQGSGNQDGNDQASGDQDGTTVPAGPIEDNKGAPIEYGGVLEFDAEIQANHMVYFSVYRVGGTYFTLKTNDAYVVYNGVTYKPSNGVISFPVTTDGFNRPVNLAICNTGAATATFHVDFVYPAGHMMNPIPMPTGDFTVTVAEGSETGIFYSFKPSKAGTLTLSIRSITNYDAGEISVQVTNANGIPKVYLLSESENGILSIELNSGDTVSLNFFGISDSWEYKGCIIEATATFN